ncbi:MAG: MFS transporter [Deltaproteobacteria bacterium]|nr:MFS transporter [Deltaproteobacteria bacterium]MBW2118021.1 MFS transporter [Deltaproteobacteria bacterium]MBW2343709.1 MFS transporter [Deltaproteobacteria bacterium]
MMNSRDRRILVITCYGHFMSHFNMLVFPAVVLPLAGRLNMDMAQVLGMSFWMYLLFGLTALPWGMAADRWGAKPFMLLFYFGAGISGFFAAFWIDAPGGLAVCLAAIGLFSGIYHPTGLGLISKEMERVSLGMGYNGMFGNLGLATAPILTGIVNWLWGPQAVYLVLGGLNLVGLALMIAFPLTQSRLTKGATSGEGDGLLGAFLILLVAMMLGGIAYRGSTVILPAYFEIKNQGIFQALSTFVGFELSSNLVATAVTSLVFLVGTVGQYTGGRVAERFEPRFCYLIFHAVTVPAVFLMAIVWDLPLVALALVYFFFLLGMQPIENTLVARFTPKRLHHSAFGTKFVLTFGVGALAVKMIGVIKVTWGIEAVFPALGMVSLALVGIILLLIKRTSPIRATSTEKTIN